MGGCPLKSNEEPGAGFCMMAFDLVPPLEIGQGNVKTSADTGKIISAENAVVAGYPAFFLRPWFDPRDYPFPIPYPGLLSPLMR